MAPFHSRIRASIGAPHGSAEGGQVTVVAAAVAALLLGGVLGVALIGAAMLERRHAALGADAVAVATAFDEVAGVALADWYRTREIEVDRRRDDDVVVIDARRGDATAQSAARVVRTPPDQAPAVVAVVARARQLVQAPLDSARIEGVVVHFDAGDAVLFATVADELVMCEVVPNDGGSARVWSLC